MNSKLNFFLELSEKLFTLTGQYVETTKKKILAWPLQVMLLLLSPVSILKKRICILSRIQHEKYFCSFSVVMKVLFFLCIVFCWSYLFVPCSKKCS